VYPIVLCCVLRLRFYMLLCIHVPGDNILFCASELDFDIYLYCFLYCMEIHIGTKSSGISYRLRDIYFTCRCR